MKRIKIKYLNLLKLFVLGGCIGLIAYDLYILLIYPIISGTLTSLTIFGLLMFVLAVVISLNIIEQIKSVSTIQPDTL